MSTAEITDATPAGAVAHIASRGCQGPLNMASCAQDRKSAGGAGSIAEQTVDHGVDVVLGGGKARFDQVIPAGEGPHAGKTVLQQAQSLGYAVVTDKAGLAAAQPGKKLLGLFTPRRATRARSRRSTPAPRSASPRKARRPRTSSA